MRRACRRVRAPVRGVKLRIFHSAQQRPACLQQLRLPIRVKQYRREMSGVAVGHLSAMAVNLCNESGDKRRNRPQIAEMAIHFRSDLCRVGFRPAVALQKAGQIREPHSCRNAFTGNVSVGGENSGAPFRQHGEIPGEIASRENFAGKLQVAVPQCAARLACAGSAQPRRAACANPVSLAAVRPSRPAARPAVVAASALSPGSEACCSLGDRCWLASLRCFPNKLLPGSRSTSFRF